MSQTRSAYPAPVDDLLDRARDYATDLGRLPGRNELMRQLKVGGPKAAEVLHLLTAEALPDEETEPDPAESAGPDEGAADSKSTALAAETADPGLAPSRQRHSWWLLGLIAPAFIAIWSGWVELGELTGFGVVHPLPGIWDSARLNTAITLPIGMETYAAYALRVLLTPSLPGRARRFAGWSALGALLLGASGQVAAHLMTASGMSHAPWQITTLVACLPVGVLGMGAALAHLLRNGEPS